MSFDLDLDGFSGYLTRVRAKSARTAEAYRSDVQAYARFCFNQGQKWPGCLTRSAVDKADLGTLSSSFRQSSCAMLYASGSPDALACLASFSGILKRFNGRPNFTDECRYLR